MGVVAAEEAAVVEGVGDPRLHWEQEVDEDLCSLTKKFNF